MTFSPEEAPVTKTELNDIVRTFIEHPPARFSTEYVTEIAVAFLGPLIAQAMDDLAELDGALIAGRAQPGDRVQGGESVAVEERAMSAQERLDALPPKAVALARGLRDVPGEKTRSYVAGLLAGLHGELLRARAGLSQKKHAEMQTWLHGFVQRRIGPLPKM